MKTRINHLSKLSFAALPLLLGTVLVGVMPSCTDEIDTSNYVTKTEPLIWDYLDSVDTYSDYAAILKIVRTGKGDNTSSLASLMASYGNYTCFAPSNEAIRNYVLEQTDSTTSDWRVLLESDTTAIEAIAYNSIIDCGDETAYSVADFPTDGGSFALQNLNNRTLTCLLNDDAVYVIAGSAKCELLDVQLDNGYLHGVDGVIALSTSTLPELISAAPNLKIMGMLLERTGWADSMSNQRADEDYDVTDYDDTYMFQSDGGYTVDIADYRYLSYTGFVEPDDVYAEKWGISVELDDEGNLTNEDEILQIITEKAQAVYGTDDVDDLTSTDNAVNRFVAYHFLKGGATYNRLVRHYNEYGYDYGDAANPQTTLLSIDVWDYYSTIGPRPRLLKVTQDAEESDYPIYINRMRTYNNSRTGNYRHATTDPDIRGALVSSTNQYVDEEGVTQTVENSAENGYYYVLDDIIMFDDVVANQVLNERIRIDVTTLMPEMWSANIRGSAGAYFPNDYFDNVLNVTDATTLVYLQCGVSGGGTQWYDYQGDEIQLQGVFDATFRLHPVPTAGRYEFRFGMQMNSRRGMAQLYFGTDPNNLEPMGLPIDLRLLGEEVGSNETVDESIYMVYPWDPDETDEESTLEIESNLRNQGYMKGSNYYFGANDLTARNNNQIPRRIVTTERMDPDETYYIRFKSVLETTDAQFVIDFFEFVPVLMIDQGTEDIW